jgi:hypothetical protein
MDKIEKIIVSDNFLNADELKSALEIITSKSWKWGHASLGQKRIETPFWSMDLMEEPYFKTYLTNVIETHFSKKFKVNRIYANAHTFGQDGVYHMDDKSPNAYTFCLYLTNIDTEYVETAGGHIYFKIPELNYKICFEPLYNRGILFPSNYTHKGCAYTRYVMDLRICVAWKLEEII